MFDSAAVLDRPSALPDDAPHHAAAPHPGRLICRIEGARDPNLLTRLVSELARRSRVPDHLATAPLECDPSGQWIALTVTLSGPQEAAHLAARIATWPVVWSVRRLDL
ncbi:hypothetical protein F1188_03695 [Roseospira marina]|uniref:NIL domain-containing protein n=1 Tax=Roseospira marina TaxID=140057 RepID=A0A5M6IFG2_9PROT|nr:hypothetical protein [Roseospira marina]KAA5607020.1 hypothetical protein F1188_03695 [Roseospira marina]MBB4312795.1 hypothetical protein [Roseospira marina]MBB5086432.1 hypothetical protein [Roseospira marina]